MPDMQKGASNNAPENKLAIVAALEREVRPLIKNWRVGEKQHDGRSFRFFEGRIQESDVVVVCGGIGAEAARRAAEAVIALFAPSVIYSVGFAGALDSTPAVGNVVEPRRVINASDSSIVTLDQGQGTLVTFASVAGPAQKAKLHEAFSAQAVDMEAAAVARAAELRGIKFAVAKVISDEFDFSFPPTEKFVDFAGQFSEARFAIFAAIRPWLWPQVIRLARNSNRASHSLCVWLEKNLTHIPPASDQDTGTQTLEAVNRR
jgi:adenosylhomocysteine nucleosidase